MLDEIRRFQARKQTGAPSKRPQGANGAGAFDFSGIGAGAGMKSQAVFAGFSGVWSSSTQPARQTSPAVPAQKTPQAQAQSAFGLPPKPDDGHGGFFGRPSTSAALPAQRAPPPSTPTAAARPGAVSPLASTVHAQLGQAASSIAELEAATEREALETEALAVLTKLGYKGLKIEDLGKLNPPDEFEEELQVMAEVRAYFHVAYKVSRVHGVFVYVCDEHDD